MRHYIYILQSQKDNGFYVGMTKDVEHRFTEHNLGKVNSTKLRIPFSLIYTEEVADRKLARIREKYWKSGAGREKIKKRLRIVLNRAADLPLGHGFK